MNFDFEFPGLLIQVYKLNEQFLHREMMNSYVSVTHDSESDDETEVEDTRTVNEIIEGIESSEAKAAAKNFANM